MWEILPDSATVHAILEWLLFAVLVMFALGIGFFALAFGAMGLDKVKREGKRLLGQPELLAAAEGLAAVNVAGLRKYVDDPNDMLILLITQTLRQDPAATVKWIDGAFTVFGHLQSIWPQIKDALGLTGTPGGAAK